LFLLPLRWAGSDRVVVYWVTPVNPDADAETEMDYRPPRRSLAADWRRKEMGGIAREREREKREDLSSPPQQRPVQLGGNRTDANFLAHC
jgi:hypothetical protein